MARLPQPGGDSNNWGTILNDFLSQSHATDGTLKQGAVTEATLSSQVVTKLNSTTNVADGSVSTAKLADGAITDDKIAASAAIAQTKISGLTTDLGTKVDKVTGKQLSTEDYTTPEKTKLQGVATGATANDTDANLKNRSNHTGTQVAATISDLADTIDGHFGRVVHTGPRTRAGVIATLNKAEAMGMYTIAYFPPGAAYELDTGLSLSGYSCQIQGGGSGTTSSASYGTVFQASTQSGPVLDFTGMQTPYRNIGRICIGGFMVQGSNVADATKANIGIKFGALWGAKVSDIVVRYTGGPCIKLIPSTPGYAAFFNEFSEIILQTPVSARDNDVPYFHSIEANGNRFSGIGFRSPAGTADTGASGAAIIEGSASYPTHDNKFTDWWFEYLHIPNGGCYFSLAGNANIVQDFQFFDFNKESGATGTAYYRLLNSSVVNAGANMIRGQIPGNDPAQSTSIDYGVDVRQSNNTIDGVKSYKGQNVILASGVGRTFVHLKGGLSSATNLGWVDNSGQTTNHLIDEYAQTEVRPSGWTGGARSATVPDIQVFTANGTWTKPANAATVEVMVISGGSGGGSGRRGASGTVCGGGGGGSSGVIIRNTFDATDLGATVSIVIGAGGNGGAAVTVDGTNGNVGSTGGQTVFGAHLVAPGGSGGAGGTTSGGAGGISPLIATTVTVMGAGGAGGTGATGTAANPAIMGPTAGPGGGGISAAPAAFNGAAGANSRMAGSGVGGAAGVVDSTPPTAGTMPTPKGSPGQSSGGGAASITTAAQAGADATGYGAGGAGGGASLNGFNSGAGGKGGPGCCLVITRF